jgi:phosphotransferase system enzyme I (PtsI)
MNQRGNMYKIQGISVSAGIAIGKARIIKDKALIVEDRKIDDVQINAELEYFRTSIDDVIKEIDLFAKNFDITPEDEAIIETHKMILMDPDFHASVENLVINDKKNLENAVHIHFTRAIEYFKNLNNTLYAERAIDYDDVYRRLMMHLKRIDSSIIDEINAGDIVLMNDILPSLVSQLHRKGVHGIILSKGTKTSHSVIISRAVGLPIVTGIKFNHIIHNDDILIIDAKKGLVIGNPPDDIFSNFAELQKKMNVELNELYDYIDLIPTSANAEKLRILSNIDLPIEVDSVIELKTDGIGLFRTEFFYLDRQALPTEEEQYNEYKRIAEKLNDKQFVIRTIDIGGDKVAGWYSLEREANPNLGCRGIRFSLKYKNIFKAQLRAILRASVYGNIHIMFPMIATVEEFLEAKSILNECKNELQNAKIPFDDDIIVGTMIETPSAAVCADALAKVSDFFSIGTNDLLQYTVAVDRNNENIANYYNPYNPAFLFLVLKTINSAKKQNIPVAICGEMASDTEFTAFLLNAGVKELSVGIDHTLRIKKHIRSIDTFKGEQFINQLYDCSTINETKKYIEKINNICVGGGGAEA